LREVRCRLRADCRRLTGKPEVTFSGGPRRRCPEVGLGEVKSPHPEIWQHRPWGVQAGARKTLEVVLAHRLHCSGSGSNAEKLRADAKAGRNVAEERIDGRDGKGCEVRQQVAADKKINERHEQFPNNRTLRYLRASATISKEDVEHELSRFDCLPATAFPRESRGRTL